MSEAAIWRTVAVILAALIALCVIANLWHEGLVPHQITLALFGSLVALGVGSSIIYPRPASLYLTPSEEKKFRKTQYRVGFVFSIVFALLMLVKEVRQSSLVWLFLPFVVLPFVLVIREIVVGGRSTADDQQNRRGGRGPNQRDAKR